MELSDVSIEIQTEHLPNTGPGSYRYGNSLCVQGVYTHLQSYTVLWHRRSQSKFSSEWKHVS
jgi:hypothetical protein